MYPYEHFNIKSKVMDIIICFYLDYNTDDVRKSKYIALNSNYTQFFTGIKKMKKHEFNIIYYNYVNDQSVHFNIDRETMGYIKSILINVIMNVKKFISNCPDNIIEFIDVIQKCPLNADYDSKFVIQLEFTAMDENNKYSVRILTMGGNCINNTSDFFINTENTITYGEFANIIKTHMIGDKEFTIVGKNNDIITLLNMFEIVNYTNFITDQQ
jgi:hypothetical protein